jgi:Cu(I)/Ag(I) efflux system membrane fusion protein
VTTKAGGWIEHLAVAATGDPVKRGQVLAEIYAPDLVAAEEEYLVAARMGGAMAGMPHGDPGALAAASLQRLRALDVPEDEIARLRKTGKAQRRIAVRAPADGVVIDKPAQEGMRIEAGQPLYKTADLTDIWLIAEVQERDLGLIAPGLKADAQFVAFPGRSFAGTVEFIYPSLSGETRTGRVRIVMPNPIRRCAPPCMRVWRSPHRPRPARCWRCRPPPSSTAVCARWCSSIAATAASSRARCA